MEPEVSEMSGLIRKAVFPAAGLGTRFLPATKAQPKEMLPLVDKPIIQYGVEEVHASGINNIILVTGQGKSTIRDHFDVNIELETFLRAHAKSELATEIRSISQLVAVTEVRQDEPLGLGHAVFATRDAVGDEPFVVVLSDDVIDATQPAVKQLIDVFANVDGPLLAVARVPPDKVSSYGIVAVELLNDRLYRVHDLVEKPSLQEAPSNLAIIGRYILTPDIFPALAKTNRDCRGEIQLTDGLRQLRERRPIFAYEIDGVRHDTGTKLGFLQASVYFALRHPNLAKPFRDYLQALDIEKIPIE